MHNSLASFNKYFCMAGSTLTFRFTNFITHKYKTLITTIWSYTLRPLTIQTKLAFVTTFYNFGPETCTYIFSSCNRYNNVINIPWLEFSLSIMNLQLSLTYMRHTNNSNKIKSYYYNFARYSFNIYTANGQNL